MATDTKDDVPLTPGAGPLDLVTVYPDLANSQVDIQNKGKGSSWGNVFLTWSASATAPQARLNGMRLAPGEGYDGTAAHIWVEADGAPVILGITKR